MGAMAELRPIIVISSFMAIVVVLISIMPSGFFGSNATTVTPENQNFYSILGTNNTLVFNLTGNSHNFGNMDFGGWHINVQEIPLYFMGKMTIWIQVADAWYGYFYNREDFIWNNQEGTVKSIHESIMTGGYLGETHDVLKISTVNETYLSSNITALIYYIKSSRTTIKVFFNFNTSYYSNPYDAYNNENLTLIMGIDFNERNTQINAWSVIGSFLTFQLIPNCDPTIALLIEIPFWFAEIYVVFIMVLRVVGAVFGGGGA